VNKSGREWSPGAQGETVGVKKKKGGGVNERGARLTRKAAGHGKAAEGREGLGRTKILSHFTGETRKKEKGLSTREGKHSGKRRGMRVTEEGDGGER